ncbi:MAG: acyltransferase [Clostridium sp.]|nr:acyltransferase [Clostridium sp.]
MNTTTVNDNKKAGNRILWLSIIQGYAILLVVIGHVNGYTYNEEGEMYPLSAFVQKFCYSFHMPLFMFVSGGLLYLTRIKKKWKTSALYADKVKHLLLPFVLFTAFGFLIKIPLASVSKNPLDISFAGFVNAFFDPASGPLVELWFLGTLMWLMALYPLYKSMLRNGFTELLLLGITLVPFIAGMHPTFHGWFNLAGVSRYAFYFVSGMLFFKYNAISFFEKNRLGVVLAIAAYIVFFVWDNSRFSFVTATLGIIMSFGLAARVVKLFPNLFSSFSGHSFQIYLVGIFPQMFIELIVWRHFHPAGMLLPFYIVSVVLALAFGVMVSRYGSRIPFRFLRWGLGLK